MLSGNFEEPNFDECYLKAKQYLEQEFSQYLIKSEWVEINYPIDSTPDKINSLSFDKEPIYEDVLTGIKGQYLIFKNNRVLNIRKHTGYSIEINY
jgi:hypothetical protein